MVDWQSIVQGHRGLVWQTVYRIVGNWPDAEDCFQETFVSALEYSRREEVRDWAALLRWLATKRALDRLRRRLRQGARSAGPVDCDGLAGRQAGPGEEAEAAELAENLREALGQLPPAQAEAFCLRFVESRSYREIARQMGVGVASVGVLLHRARRRLRARLGSMLSEK